MVPPLFTPLSQEGPQGVWHRQTPRAITGAPDIPYCPVMPGVQAAALGGSFTGGALPLAPNGGSLPSGDTGYFFPSSQWRLFSWMDSTPFSRLCQWFFEEREGTPGSESTKRSVTSSAPWGYTVGKRSISIFCFIGRSFLPYSPLPPAAAPLPPPKWFGTSGCPLSGGPAPLCGPGGPGLPPG